MLWSDRRGRLGAYAASPPPRYGARDHPAQGFVAPRCKVPTPRTRIARHARHRLCPDEGRSLRPWMLLASAPGLQVHDDPETKRRFLGGEVRRKSRTGRSQRSAARGAWLARRHRLVVRDAFARSARSPGDGAHRTRRSVTTCSNSRRCDSAPDPWSAGVSSIGMVPKAVQTLDRARQLWHGVARTSRGTSMEPAAR